MYLMLLLLLFNKLSPQSRLFSRSQKHFWGSLQSQEPNVSTNLSRCSERVLRGNVLDVVGERVVGQDVVGLVDAVHGVLEGELRWRVLLVIFGRGNRKGG